MILINLLRVFWRLVDFLQDHWLLPSSWNVRNWFRRLIHILSDAITKSLICIFLEKFLVINSQFSHFSFKIITWSEGHCFFKLLINNRHFIIQRPVLFLHMFNIWIARIHCHFCQDATSNLFSSQVEDLLIEAFEPNLVRKPVVRSFYLGMKL